MSESTDPKRLSPLDARLDEITARMKAASANPPNWPEFFRLCRELNELGLRNGLVDEAVAADHASEMANFEKQLSEAERRAKELCREPTREELEWLAFVQKLADRQGTTMPDFDALYRRKAELDSDSRSPELP